MIIYLTYRAEFLPIELQFIEIDLQDDVMKVHYNNEDHQTMEQDFQ